MTHPAHKVKAKLMKKTVAHYQRIHARICLIEILRIRQYGKFTYEEVAAAIQNSRPARPENEYGVVSFLLREGIAGRSVLRCFSKGGYCLKDCALERTLRSGIPQRKRPLLSSSTAFRDGNAPQARARQAFSCPVHRSEPLHATFGVETVSR
jgi:hypothetical protein